MAAKASADVLLQLAKARRTIYPLTKDLPITASRIQDIVRETTLHTPTAFNSQTNRAVVLFGAEHDKLWDIASATLKAIVPEDKWQTTADRLALFKGGAGTVLFFEDTDAVKALQAKIPIYAERFPHWASQALGIQQFLAWTALEAEGLGANLQHYNPLIDKKVAETWGLPESWRLDAQLVFGGKTDAAVQEKAFQPVEERVKVFGA